MSLAADDEHDGHRPARAAVCVITYRRPAGLAKLLARLASQDGVDRRELAVVVVDNDPELSAAPVVEAARREGLSIAYAHEPVPGIPRARNRSVELGLRSGAPLLCFIDDDELPASSWLERLLARAASTDAPILTGPVQSILPGDAPRWLERSRLFSRPRHPTGERRDRAATGNAMVDRRVFEELGSWFDESLQLTGGEDSDFFCRAHLAGHAIEWCDEAVVHEEVSPERCNLRWIGRRCLRGAMGHARIARRYAGGARAGARCLAVGSLRMAWGATLAAATLGLAPVARLRIVENLALGAGLVLGTLGVRAIQEYRRAPSAQRFSILIAHQSTVPHYRVPFYRAVQRLKPDRWSFAVVFDPDPASAQSTFGEAVEAAALDFPVERARAWPLPLARGARYQPFLRRARAYDLVVLEDAFSNLSYPLARLLLPRRVRIAYWGHGRDLHTTAPSAAKRWLEERKLRAARAAAGFFAYTAGVRDFLIANGVDPERIFVLHNTIDILDHRRHFDALRESRQALRAAWGAADARLLLYVGRVNASKRVDLLAAAVEELRRRDERYRLIVAGGGEPALLDELRRVLGSEGFDYRGVLVEPADLAPLFVASDAFVLPGLVGLAPLTSLCYDLTPILIANPAHGPEVEYFDDSNAVIVAAATQAEGYAREIHRLFEDRERWARLRAAAWPSIRHLTIESMARSFIAGVDTLLAASGARRPGADPR